MNELKKLLEVIELEHEYVHKKEREAADANNQSDKNFYQGMMQAYEFIKAKIKAQGDQ